MLFLISVLVFSSVYLLVYQVFLYRQMHASLSLIEVSSGEEQAVRVRPLSESPARKFLRLFSFLAKPKAARFLAGRSVPSKLVMAGAPLSIIEFIIFKILSSAIFMIIATIIAKKETIFIYAAAGFAVGFILPDIWLKLKVNKRHGLIRRDLSAVIDLLNLCVGSGLDFMQAVNRVVGEFKKSPLIDELSEVWRETQMGASRREALQHLARRVNMTELSSFVRTLLQADRMGAPMGEALKIQSEEIRMHLFLKGEEAALKAPIKLLFPLFVFILPAILIIVAGPIFLQFMRGGVKF